MTIDKTKLRALAEAFPADLDWDSNTEPFFNGPSGESLGGGSTGFYSVYGQPFKIEGEQYDGTEYVSICTREFAEFVCSARDGVLALLGEIERLEARNLAQMRVNLNQRKRRKEWVERAGIAEDEAIDAEEQRDQFKAEVAQLKNQEIELKVESARLRADYAALSTFNPDWDRVAAAQDTVRESMDTISQLKAEKEALRKIISESATACGAAVSVECSLEFMAMLPGEIASVVGGLRRDGERYRALRKGGYLDNWVDLHICDEPRRAELTDAAIDVALIKGASHG